MAKMRGYKHWSIKAKLLTITILLIVGSVLSVTVFAYAMYTKDFREQSANKVQQTIIQLSNNIENYIDELYYLSEAPYYNDALMNLLEQEKARTDVAQLIKSRSIEKLLDNMMITPRKDILSAYLISDAVYYGGRHSRSVDYAADYTAYDWYEEALALSSPIFVPTHMEQLCSNPRYEVISVVRRINSIKDGESPLAVIKIDAYYSSIDRICNEIDTGQDGGLFVFSRDGAVVYANSANIDESELIGVLGNEEKEGAVFTFNGKKYLANITIVPRANWSIVALHSVSELNKAAEITKNTTILITIGCIIVAIAILMIFARSFLQPLFEIIHCMNKVEQGKMDTVFPEQRTDEIGYLGRSFNSMVHRINKMMNENVSLVKKIYETRLLQSETQINMLQSRIKPHFIFNTLNLISLLIQNGENDKAIDHIEKLSDLMRVIAYLDRDITIEKEMHLLESYLGIQSSRYGERLVYSINIDKRVYSYQIPALILQPIVENAVIHGCEKRKETTTIKVGSEVSDNLLILYCEDNADGIDEKRLEELRKSLLCQERQQRNEIDTEKEKGIGLINVHQRIQLRFGNEYGVVIESQKSKGTRAEIRLPMNSVDG